MCTRRDGWYASSACTKLSQPPKWDSMFADIPVESAAASVQSVFLLLLPWLLMSIYMIKTILSLIVICVTQCTRPRVCCWFILPESMGEVSSVQSVERDLIALFRGRGTLSNVLDLSMLTVVSDFVFWLSTCLCFILLVCLVTVIPVHHLYCFVSTYIDGLETILVFSHCIHISSCIVWQCIQITVFFHRLFIVVLTLLTSAGPCITCLLLIIFVNHSLDLVNFSYTLCWPCSFEQVNIKNRVSKWLLTLTYCQHYLSVIKA